MAHAAGGFAPDRFSEKAAGEDELAESIELELSLRYDWQRHACEYRVGSDSPGVVEITSIAGDPLFVIRKLQPGDWRPCGESAAVAIRTLLSSTSFVMARRGDAPRDRGWRILIREEGMTHKPSFLADLTPEEILQYWSLAVARSAAGLPA